MTRWTVLLALLPSLGHNALAQSQSPRNCKVRFTVVRKDALNNVQQGLVNDDLKWMQTKMAQKYPELCYVPPDSSVPVVFYVALSNDTYHGTKTVTDTHRTEGTTQGTITDTNPGSGTYGQQVGTVEGTTEGTTTTDREVPYSFPYTILTLSVETREPNGSWKVRRNIQNNSIHHEMYGIAVTNRHPYHSLIEQAILWLHNGGLDNPLQVVLSPQSDSIKAATVAPVVGTGSSSAANVSAKLAVSSTPEGADIEVDGTFVGNTPSELSLTEGNHTIQIKKAGFKAWERMLKTSGGSTVRISAELEKATK